MNAINDFFRFTDELTLEIPALPHPTLEEFQAKFPWIKRTERDTSPTEAVTLTLGTVLRPEETDAINGKEYENRLAPKLDVVLGYQQAVWTVEHEDDFPELRAFHRNVYYIDFPGLVVVDENGVRLFPYITQSGGRWELNWRWFGSAFDPGGRVGSSRKGGQR